MEFNFDFEMTKENKKNDRRTVETKRSKTLCFGNKR